MMCRPPAVRFWVKYTVYFQLCCGQGEGKGHPGPDGLLTGAVQKRVQAGPQGATAVRLCGNAGSPVPPAAGSRSAAESAAALLRHLFQRYQKWVRPVLSSNDTVKVHFGLKISQLVDVVSNPAPTEKNTRPSTCLWAALLFCFPPVSAIPV